MLQEHDEVNTVCIHWHTYHSRGVSPGAVVMI